MTELIDDPDNALKVARLEKENARLQAELSKYQSPNPHTESYYAELRTKDQRKFLEHDTQLQMARDAEALGEAFFDARDPDEAANKKSKRRSMGPMWVN